MIEFLSFALAAMILIGLIALGLAIAYDASVRVRDRLLPPPVQLQRAGLGKYPHWRK